jgi:hypothetical protein
VTSLDPALLIKSNNTVIEGLLDTDQEVGVILPTEWRICGDFIE